MSKVYVIYSQFFYLGPPEKVFSSFKAAKKWLKENNKKFTYGSGMNDEGYRIKELEVED